ncbi:hypothetical protein [Streptomyces antibioticus]|uniref:Uncharacterized protein n=1 Tax=Streptomyces antibioticus TaxID=1890 RepID=A0AAE6YCQ2_STRAT|nr:hypothetical protein [Streptomyces antibioticus]QIT47655.1 hypothetical protein HCX60_32390 [Streptomyces antibioticus]
MARLQILPLPEGTGDDRPPFVLVVDQMEPQRYVVGEGMEGQPDHWDVVAKRIGARGAIVLPDTVEIPANGPLPLPEVDEVSEADFTTMATAVHQALGIDITEGMPDIAGWLLAACRELEKSEAARTRLRTERDRANEALTRVRDLTEQPEVMNVNPESPYATQDGYAQGIRAAKRAIEDERSQTAEHGG